MSSQDAENGLAKTPENLARLHGQGIGKVSARFLRACGRIENAPRDLCTTLPHWPATVRQPETHGRGGGARCVAV